MDAGNESITDADVLEAVRAQARRINLQSLIGAAVLTALFVFFQNMRT